jgi:hypothetical protein
MRKAHAETGCMYQSSGSPVILVVDSRGAAEFVATLANAIANLASW